MNKEHDFGLDWVSKRGPDEAEDQYYLVNQQTKRVFGAVTHWKAGFYKVESLAFDLKPTFWLTCEAAKDHLYNKIRDKLRSGL